MPVGVPVYSRDCCGYFQLPKVWLTSLPVCCILADSSRLNIPLDTQWNDIDIFDEYRDFTTDPAKYPVDQVRAFTDYLHNNGQHYVNIIDPGIQVYPDMGYEPYDKGMDMEIFIKVQEGAVVFSFGTELWN